MRTLAPLALGALLLLAACGSDRTRTGGSRPRNNTSNNNNTNTSSTADAGVNPCACDQTPNVCDNGCACDPLCGGGCACDLTPNVCDQGCGCDPFCGGAADAGPGGQDAGPGGQDAAGFPDATPQNPDAGVPPSDPFNPASASVARAQAFCSQISRCSPASVDFFNRPEAQCVQEETIRLTPIFTAFGEGIRAGRVGFSQSAFDQCNSAIRNQDCVAGVPAGVCDDERTFTGAQPIGAPCFLTVECANNLFCQLSSAGAQCGTCAPRANTGAPCDQALCGSGENCFEIGGGQTACLSDTLAQGAQCGTVQTGLCNGYLQCVGSAGAATCQPPGQTVGATCDAANQSAANCDINQSLLCDNGSCIQVSWVGVGAMCDLTNQCNGLTGGCDGTTCSPPPSSGQACQQSCATGYYCASSGVCVVVSGQGGSCTEAGGCQNGLSCINSSCQPFTYQTCN